MVIPDLKRLCLALCLTSIALPCLSDGYWAYRWTDENGVIHFSQVAGNETAERIRIDAPSAIAPVTSEFDKQDDQTPENNKTPTESSPSEDQLTQQKEAFEKNCQVAQENKKIYEDNPGRRFSDADGNVVRLTEEERQAKIQQAQEQIDFYCK